MHVNFKEISANINCHQSTLMWTRTMDYSDKNLSIADKLQAVHMYYCENYADYMSMREYAVRHNIAFSTFKDWKKKYDQFVQSGVLTMYQHGGRPPLIDIQGIEDIKNQTEQAVRSQHTLNPHEFKRVVNDGIVSTKRRRCIDIGTYNCSNKYIENLKKKHNFGNAQRHS